MEDIYDIANGHWDEILQNLGGLTSQQLTNEDTPCPCCGGKDRFRYDNAKITEHGSVINVAVSLELAEVATEYPC